MKSLFQSLAVSCLAVFALMAETPKPSAAPSAVGGSYIGNGKAAKIAFVSARKGEPFSGKETTVLIFTEKDHSKSERTEMKAAFGEFGSALVITVHPDGDIIGCQVAHNAHTQKPFSSIGKIKMADFKTADGKIQGRLTTEGKAETFEQTWEVDLKFATKAP